MALGQQEPVMSTYIQPQFLDLVFQESNGIRESWARGLFLNALARPIHEANWGHCLRQQEVESTHLCLPTDFHGSPWSTHSFSRLKKEAKKGVNERRFEGAGEW